MSIESFIFSSISFLSKKERAFALSFIRKLFFYYLDILRFITIAPNRTSTPENTRPVATTSPVLGRRTLRPPPLPSAFPPGFPGVVVVPSLPGVVVVVVVASSLTVVVVVVSPSPSPPPWLSGFSGVGVVVDAKSFSQVQVKS